jgi:outer membrane protein assembly factor BamB
VSISAASLPGAIREVVEGDHIIGGTSGVHNSTYVQKGTLWSLSLKRGQEGTLLWTRDFTPPQSTVEDVKYVSLPGLFSYGYMTGPTVDSADGVFLFEEAISRKRWTFDLDTMQQLWESAPEDQWNFYGMSRSIYEGKLLGYGYSGVLIAYNITTGKVLWNWTSGTVGFEGYYQNTPLSLACIADGKIYLYSTEHSPSMPLRRDAYLWCVDTETGDLLWKIQCWANNPAIADGYIVTLDSFDNQIYCFGKGPSATTVSASPEISVHGSSVLVKGTVTDQCAGAQKLAQTLGFVDGVPAIADEDQESWMEYLYQQRPIPGNAKGVEVSLDAIDPNSNFVHIDTVTSDMSGMFSHMFIPDVPGKYTIIATFAGSKSYGASYAETAIGVDEAPPPTAPPQPIVFPPIETYFIYATVVLLIAIAIVGILLLRKHP